MSFLWYGLAATLWGMFFVSALNGRVAVDTYAILAMCCLILAKLEELP